MPIKGSDPDAGDTDSKLRRKAESRIWNETREKSRVEVTSATYTCMVCKKEISGCLSITSKWKRIAFDMKCTNGW